MVTCLRKDVIDMFCSWTCSVMDSIEECATRGPAAVVQASVACIVAMLGSLEELCTGQGISEKYTDKINSLYPHLVMCDYRGMSLPARLKLKNSG